MIVYELLDFREYRPGSIIISQAKRSSLNLDYKGFYINMISKIGMQIKKSKEERLKKADEGYQLSRKKSETAESEEDLSPRQLRLKHFTSRKSSR